MEKFKVSFEANNQQLKSIGTKHASDTYADIEATFVLGEKWTDMDSVSAVWWNDFTRVATVLDSQGKCVVPHEVLARKGCVRVNLVGSIVEGDELITRLTSYSAEAVQVNEKIKLTGSETSEITPSQYEQFVANVKADADRAEAGATASANSAQNASESATASANSASDSAQSAIASAQSAQNASESAITAENAKDDAEDARDKILSMRATAETLEAGSDATASYSDGLLTLGIPRGDRGEQGIQGETGATPNLTIGTVETLAPTEDATATITGTAENPVLNLGLTKGDTGEVSLEDLGALLPTDTASGDIVTIPDGQSVIPAESLKVALEPIQDLNGYDKPWAGGAGKNKLPVSCESVVKNGVTYTVYKNGAGAVTRIHAEGTSTSAHAFSVVEGHSASNPFTLKAGSYWFKALSNGVGGSFDFNLRKKGESTDIVQITNKVALTLAEDTEFQSCYLYMYNGKTINADIYPMIWLQSESNDDFEPYSNICPISGHTEVNTIVSPTQSASDGTTYTTTLGRTVYGGTLDVVSGELVVNKKGIVFDGSSDEDWRPYSGQRFVVIVNDYTSPLTSVVDDIKANYLETVYKGAQGARVGVISGGDYTYHQLMVNMGLNSVAEMREYLAQNPLQVVYPLATPQTIQLNPQEVKLLLGTNNIWSDGNVTLVYSADIQKWVEKKLNGNSTTLTMSRPMTAELNETETETTETEETE